MSLLTVKYATVLTGHGPDKISLDLEAESPFPVMGYKPTAMIEAQKGEGANWVRRTLGVEPQIIEM